MEKSKKIKALLEALNLNMEGRDFKPFTGIENWIDRSTIQFLKGELNPYREYFGALVLAVYNSVITYSPILVPYLYYEHINRIFP